MDMTEENFCHLLENVVELTSQREHHALRVCMVKTLQEFISAEDIALYEISSDQARPALKLLAAVEAADQGTNKQKRSPAIPAIEADPDLMQCFTTKERVVSNWEDKSGEHIKSGVRVIHPVKSVHGLIGFLIIKCASFVQKDQDMAFSFLRIYHNYLQLIDATEHDTLTGLLNRKSFIDRMMAVLTQKRADQRRFKDTPANQQHHCLAILDIDNFKKVNDQFGHLQGDEVLLRFARLMTQTFRDEDQLYRYGGEEFVVLLRGVDLETGITILDRFRKKVEVFDIPQVGRITASIGVVEINNQELPTTVVEQADRALYYAKDNGRNQVFAFEKLLAAGKLTSARTSGDIELF